MNSDVYGSAEFQPGMEEIEETPTPTSAPVPAETAVPVTQSPVPATQTDTEDAVVVDTDTTTAGNDGLSLTQKALFLAVIASIVAVYIRLNMRSAPPGPTYSRV